MTSVKAGAEVIAQLGTKFRGDRFVLDEVRVFAISVIRRK